MGSYMVRLRLQFAAERLLGNIIWPYYRLNFLELLLFIRFKIYLFLLFLFSQVGSRENACCT